MSFYRDLKNTILKLNGDISDVANQEKAKKLRKNLLIWGAILATIGVIGIVACFIGFFVASFKTFGDMKFGFPTGVFAAMIMFVISGFVAAIGFSLLHLGFSILIAGVTTKFIDKSINDRCECGYDLTKKDKFCPRCGRPIQKKCPNCGAVNDRNNKFCNNCGNELN